jgi:hypothetical protein
MDRGSTKPLSAKAGPSDPAVTRASIVHMRTRPANAIAGRAVERKSKITIDAAAIPCAVQ